MGVTFLEDNYSEALKCFINWLASCLDIQDCMFTKKKNIFHSEGIQIFWQSNNSSNKILDHAICHIQYKLTDSSILNICSFDLQRITRELLASGHSIDISPVTNLQDRIGFVNNLLEFTLFYFRKAINISTITNINLDIICTYKLTFDVTDDASDHYEIKNKIKEFREKNNLCVCESFNVFISWIIKSLGFDFEIKFSNSTDNLKEGIYLVWPISIDSNFLSSKNKTVSLVHKKAHFTGYFGYFDIQCVARNLMLSGYIPERCINVCDIKDHQERYDFIANFLKFVEGSLKSDFSLKHINDLGPDKIYVSRSFLQVSDKNIMTTVSQIREAIKNVKGKIVHRKIKAECSLMYTFLKAIKDTELSKNWFNAYTAFCKSQEAWDAYCFNNIKIEHDELSQMRKQITLPIKSDDFTFYKTRKQFLDSNFYYDEKKKFIEEFNKDLETTYGKEKVFTGNINDIWELYINEEDFNDLQDENHWEIKIPRPNFVCLERLKDPKMIIISEFMNTVTMPNNAIIIQKFLNDVTEKNYYEMMAKVFDSLTKVDHAKIASAILMKINDPFCGKVKNTNEKKDKKRKNDSDSESEDEAKERFKEKVKTLTFKKFLMHIYMMHFHNAG